MSRPWTPSARVYDRKTKEFVTVKLSVDIDWQAIAAQLAAQAMQNKSRKATQLHGAIKAKIVKEGE